MPEARLDVAFLPSELRETEVAVVVDVLRATSTVTQALAAGCEAVRCAPSLEAARALKAPGRVLAGERRCLPVPGFELGNSPAALRGETIDGELVLATTNGTPAIAIAAARAETTLIGCLLNLDALVAALAGRTGVTVVCSGTDGRFALEDAYVAGRIVDRLAGERTDAARAAARIARAYADPLDPLAESADGRLLHATGQDADIAWCATESALELVPGVLSADGGAPVVGARGGCPAGVTNNRAIPM